MKHLQRMLGHKDAAMTLNVYASQFEDDLNDVADRLEAALTASPAPLRALDAEPVWWSPRASLVRCECESRSGRRH